MTMFSTVSMEKQINRHLIFTEIQNHVLSLLPTHPFSLCHKFCIFFGRLPLAFLDKAVSTVFQRQCGAEGRHIVIRPFHPDSTGEIKAMFCKRWHSLYSVICWLTRERISKIKHCPFPMLSIKDLDPSMLNGLITLKGVVIHMSKNLPDLQAGVFR